MKRIYNIFNCPIDKAIGREVRRVDLLRNCPWSIIAHMECDCGNSWGTYIRDESRITPFDIEDEDMEE